MSIWSPAAIQTAPWLVHGNRQEFQFTRARIFSSLFISLLPRDSNWKKEEREKIKNKKKKNKKERKKEGKRGREGNEERFSFIYFCQVSCKVNESPRPKGRKLEKWQPFCFLVISVLHVTVTRGFQFSF